VGLYAHKLGINLLTIAIKSAYFETLSHIFGKLGYDIKNIFISGMGILRYILEKENLNKGLYIILDIGAQVTDIVAYQDKRIMHIGCISFGGDKLTERIAQEFNLSFELAEELKLNYGTVVESPLKDKEIMIKDYNHYKRIQQSRLNQILNREVNDFLLSLRDYFSKNLENRKIDKIFVYGRTALLDGLLEKMEGELTVPVRMVSYSDFPFLKDLSLSSNLSIPQLLDYANCLNAISQTEWFFSEKSTPINLPTGIFKRIISWVRQLYQEYF
jgi:cell division protein FtsA